MTVPMAAISSISNPISADQFLIFFVDPNYQLNAVQQYKSELDRPAFDFNTAVQPDIPSGNIANPSSIAAVQFSEAICVYGVLIGTTPGDYLVCRLSPGFQLLNIGQIPIAQSNAIAACSNGDDKGSLFYVVNGGDIGYSVRVIALPGTSQTSEQVPININMLKTTYLGAAYGTLAGKAPTGYVGVQGVDNNIYIFDQAAEVSARVNGGKGLKRTPIALVLERDILIVYFFGPVGSGGTSDAPSVCRAVTKNVSEGFVFTILDQAPSPNGYTQLGAIATPSGGDTPIGTVILSYVQNGSNQLISWADNLEGLLDPRRLRTGVLETEAPKPVAY